MNIRLPESGRPRPSPQVDSSRSVQASAVGNYRPKGARGSAGFIDSKRTLNRRGTMQTATYVIRRLSTARACV
jgi:hypothetical protein